jgi:hypothetical protein
MTAHELARKLLELPDIAVYIDREGIAEIASDAVVSTSTMIPVDAPQYDIEFVEIV